MRKAGGIPDPAPTDPNAPAPAKKDNRASLQPPERPRSTTVVPR
jgi:hypothetical protein